MLNLYDYTKFTKDPVLRTVHRKATRALPELAMMPSVLLGGTGYKTPVLKERADDEIFVAVGEGALSAKSDYKMVRNETFGIDFKVDAVARAEDAEGEITEIEGVRRFTLETEERYMSAYERIVKQLYLGVDHEAKGFQGLPAAVKYVIDAQAAAWNLNQDFDFSGDADKLYSVFLVRRADSATPEAEGAKWIWANGQTIAPTGPRRTVDIRDDAKSTETGKEATYEGLRQHHTGGVGFGFTSDIDVVEIANVPGFRVADFYLENVIAQALAVFPTSKKATHVVIHKLSQNAMWINHQNQNAGDRNVSIVAPKDEGEMSVKTPYFFDGTEEIPLVVSEVMPVTGVKAGNAADLATIHNNVFQD